MMEGFGCKAHGRLALGVRDGARGRWPYSAELLESGAKSQLAFRFAAGANPRAVAKALRGRRLQYSRWLAEPDGEGGVLVGLLTLPSDFYARASILTLLAAAVEELDAAGLHPPDSCSLCGRLGCDAYAFLDGEWRATHADCVATRLKLPEQDHTPERQVRGHVATGILGALLGAFVGAVPIWALAMQRNTVYWALYAFIPILSGLLYRSFRGKANATIAGICVLLSSLLAALALEQVWYWLVLSAEFNVNVSFWLSIRTYFQTHSLLLALSEMLFCLLALLAGFVAVTMFLRRYAGEGLEHAVTIRGARFVRGSCRPMHEEAAGDGPDELDDPPRADPADPKENPDE